MARQIIVSNISHRRTANAEQFFSSLVADSAKSTILVNATG